MGTVPNLCMTFPSAIFLNKTLKQFLQIRSNLNSNINKAPKLCKNTH